jgi:glycosyltransferase involved in cell wall biosynthesis
MGLRILLANDFYPPFIGGAERQVQLLSRALVRRGHKVDVATIWHAGLPEHQDDCGVRVHRLKALTTHVKWFSKDPRRRFHPPFPDLAVVLELRNLIRRTKPDIVNAGGWIAYSCAAALLGKRIPLVISVRDYGYTCAIRTLLYHEQVCTGPAPLKCIECASRSYGLPKALAAVAGIFGLRGLLRRKVSAVHSVSTFVEGIVQRDLFGSEEQGPMTGAVSRLDVVIPGFLTADQDGAPVQDFLGQMPDRPYILFVGALLPHKGLNVLLAAYERISSPPPLVLIGSVWPDSPKNFPPGVTVLYDAPHAVVMAAWEGCLFGVTPSVWPDPSPGVIREAMSKGKAVIAANIGGMVDQVIHNETGLLVPPDDVDMLAAALQQLIDHPELRERLGRAAQKRAKIYSSEAVVPQFERLFQLLVSDAR